MRVVLFDLDDTLLDHSGAARRGAGAFYARYAAELAMDEQDFLALWQSLTQEGFRRFAMGELSHGEQRRFRMRGLFGRGLSDVEADARFGHYLVEYERHWRLFEDVVPALEALAHVRVGVITNGSAAMQARKLSCVGLGERFECVVTPGDGQLGKPHRSIFERACQELDVAPEACAYVGDQLETDARAARDAGLLGVWLSRDPSQHTSGDVPSIAALEELLALL